MQSATTGSRRPEDFEGVKGYEYYNEIAAKFTKDSTLEFRSAHLERQTSGKADHLDELSGISDRVARVGHARLRARADPRAGAGGIDAEELIGVFKCGNMSYDVANDSMNLFAQKVLPRLQALPIAAPPTASSV